MNLPNYVQVGGATSLVDLFKEAKKNASGMPVATLAKIKSIPEFDEDIGYGIAEVEPIPSWGKNNPTFCPYYFSDSFEVGDYCLVVFTNEDFRPYVKQSASLTQQQTNSNQHSRNFGIMIKL